MLSGVMACLRGASDTSTSFAPAQRSTTQHVPLSPGKGATSYASARGGLPTTHAAAITPRAVHWPRCARSGRGISPGAWVVPRRRPAGSAALSGEDLAVTGGGVCNDPRCGVDHGAVVWGAVAGIGWSGMSRHGPSGTGLTRRAGWSLTLYPQAGEAGDRSGTRRRWRRRRPPVATRSGHGRRRPDGLGRRSGGTQRRTG